MSKENVEIARRAFAYEIYGHGDRAEAEAIFDPNVVMQPAEEGPSHGIDEIRDNMEHWQEAWDELDIEIEDVVEAGVDRVLLTAHQRARGHRSGFRIDDRYYVVYTLRRGKIIRIDEYTFHDDALEAAGLRE